MWLACNAVNGGVVGRRTKISFKSAPRLLEAAPFPQRHHALDQVALGKLAARACLEDSRRVGFAALPELLQLLLFLLEVEATV